MAHGDDIGMRLVDPGMKHKTGTIDGVLAFHYFAFMIREDEVGHLDLRKVNGHRIGPVQAGMLRVTNGEVSGKSIIKTLQRKSATSCNQPLFQMPTLISEVIELRNSGINQAGLLRLIKRNPCFFLDRGGAFEDSIHFLTPSHVVFDDVGKNELFD